MWTDGFESLLGCADWVYYCVVVDGVIVRDPELIPTLYTWTEEGSDGENWHPKRVGFDIDEDLEPYKPATYVYGDPGAVPSGGLIRYAVALAAFNEATANAHVRIWATGRAG